MAGVTLEESEKESLEVAQTELSLSSGKVEKVLLGKSETEKLDSLEESPETGVQSRYEETGVQSKSEDQQTSSSRRAKKRFAQITPPPSGEEGKKEQQSSRAQIIPAKAAKPDKGEVNKKSKIASYQGMFEKQKENNNSGTSLNRNRSSSIVAGLAGNKAKQVAPAAPVQKTQVIEVFDK